MAIHTHSITVQGQRFDLPEGHLVRFNYTKGANGKQPRRGNFGDTSIRVGYLVPVKDQPKAAIKIQVQNSNEFRTFSVAGITDLEVF